MIVQVLLNECWGASSSHVLHLRLGTNMALIQRHVSPTEAEPMLSSALWRPSPWKPSPVHIVAHLEAKRGGHLNVQLTCMCRLFFLAITPSWPSKAPVHDKANRGVTTGFTRGYCTNKKDISSLGDIWEFREVICFTLKHLVLKNTFLFKSSSMNL